MLAARSAQGAGRTCSEVLVYDEEWVHSHGVGEPVGEVVVGVDDCDNFFPLTFL